jgi:hypothetical protein
MADVISNIVEDKQEIKNQLGSVPDIMKIPKRFDSRIALKEVATKYTVRNISGAMIWGSPTYGTWGTAEWGDTAGSAFILNSASFGVLGSNSLGSGGSSDALYAVIPNNNTFVEYFGQDDFIDTVNSTGTINTSTEVYSMTAGDVLQSEVIAKLRSPITSVSFPRTADIVDLGTGMILPFELGGDTFGGDNASVEVSNDGGATWESVADINSTHTFTSSSNDDELKYRITCTADFSTDGPFAVKVNP